MAYFNLNKITPAAPNDPTVNEVTQLNNNWDNLDSKLGIYINGGSLTGIETGQEYLGTGSRFAVWDGAEFLTEDIDSAWSAWTNIPMLSPRAIRTGFQPKWRSNSLLRKVELTGGIQFDAAASAWTMGSSFQFNDLVTGSPTTTFTPIGGFHRAQCAAALTGGTSVTAAGRISIDTQSGFIKMSAQYMGGGGGGNFLQLEQVWWWY